MASAGDRIYHASKYGLDTNDGLSWDTPKRTLLAATAGGNARRIEIGAGIWDEVLRPPPHCEVVGVQGQYGGWGTVIRATSATANCIETPSEQCSIRRLTTCGYEGGAPWTGAGILLKGSYHKISGVSHQNADAACSKDKGGDGILITHAEGFHIEDYVCKSCRVAIHTLREAASGVVDRVAAVFCYSDLWIDGSVDPYGPGTMPQGVTFRDFKAVAGRATLADTPQLGTPYGYAVLADASVTDGALACRLIFENCDWDETNPSGGPITRARLNIRDSALLGCANSPETEYEITGPRNVVDKFTNQYKLTISGTNTTVRDLSNIGALHPATFVVSTPSNRIERLVNGVGATASIVTGNSVDTDEASRLAAVEQRLDALIRRQETSWSAS